MKILITGTARFIGFHLANYLIKRGDTVVGLDSINGYYDVNLKYNRLATAGIEKEKLNTTNWLPAQNIATISFIQLQLEDKANLEKLFASSTVRQSI